MPAAPGGTHEALEPPHSVLPALLLLTTTQAVVSALGAPMVPEVARIHDVSLSSAQWVLTAAMLTGAVATPVLGRLGGNRARRTVVMTGLCVVVLGLLLSALPLGFAGLIAGRVLQGTGTALLPLALAAAREAYPVERMPSILGLLTVSTVAGSGLGYPLTAASAQHFGLPSAYLVGLALTSVTAFVCWRHFPRPRTDVTDTVDWWAATLLSLATLCFLLGVTHGATHGWTSPHATLLWLAALVAGALWTRRCLASDHPLVDLRLARQRAVLPVHAVGLLAGTAIYMTMALAMVQVQTPPETGYGLGRSLTFASSSLTAYAVGTVVGNRIADQIRARVGLEGLLQLGFTIYTVAATVYLVWHRDAWSVPLAMSLSGMGGGFSFAALPALVVRCTPASETGSALSFNTLLRFLGFALGSALASSLFDTFAAAHSEASAFRLTMTVNVCLWLVALAVSLAVRRPPSAPAPSSPAQPPAPAPHTP